MNEEKTYQLNRGLLFFLILVMIPIAAILYGVISVIIDLETITTEERIWICLLFIIPISITYILCIRTYFNSEYIIKGNLLKCKLGFFTSKIEIDQIKSIGKGNYPSAGNRPALHLDGIKISYGNGRSIFLSPERTEEFIGQLLSVNKAIAINGDIGIK